MSPTQSGVQPLPERFLPDSSAVNRLLGKLYKASGDRKNAASLFAAALEENPLMWDAFTDLCDSGTNLRVPNIFRSRDDKTNKGIPAKLSLADLDSSNLTTARNLNRQRKPLSPAPPPPLNSHSSVGDELKTTKDGKRLHNDARNPFDSAPEVPTKPEPGWNENDVLATTSSSSSTQIHAPQRRSARLMNRQSTQPAPPSSVKSKDNVKRPVRLKNPVRRKQKPTPVPKQEISAQPIAVLVDEASGNKEHKCDTKEFDTGSSILPSPEKLGPLTELLRKVGSGYFYLSRFQPKQCLEAFSSLPAQQQSTPWVLSKTARAHYELMAYQEAKATFQLLRKLSPAWLEDLEVYSTVLWHLKEDIELAYLAHELSDDHFLSPQAWCAVGNSFSVRRAHYEAAKAFRRACQLSPPVAQAFSLLGYEQIEMEDYAAATAAFRRGLQVDPRHYPAWVGLGRVEEKLGEDEKALRCYVAAEKINSSNAVLMTYIARVLETAGNSGLALEYLRRGLDLSPPQNILCLIRMQAANIHLQLGQQDEALQHIRWVEQYAPGEARVHFMLGQTYAMSGENGRGAALQCYTTALSLAPWSEKIRDAISDLEDGS